MPRKTGLTEGSIGRHFVRMTIPMIWGMASVVAFSFIDTFYLARLGTEQLSAISFTFPVVMVVGSLAIGLGIGVVSVVAQSLGRGETAAAKRVSTDSLILAVAVAMAFTTIGLLTIDPLFGLLGAEQSLRPLIRDYMGVWYFGAVFLLVPMIGSNILRAGGDSRYPALIMIGGTVLNAIIDPILIFGLFGAPRLEMAGAAWATLLARAPMLVASVAILHYRERLIIWERVALRAIWNSWRAVLHVGLPAVGTNLVAPIAVGILTAIVAQFGAPAVAAFGVGARVDAVALIVQSAMNTAVGPIVGQNAGAQRGDRVREAVRVSTRLILGWGFFVAIVLAVFARPIVGIFDDDPDVVDRAVLYLRIVPWAYGAAGVMSMARAYFSAIRRPLPPVIVILVRTFVLIVPLALLGAWLFGVTGVFVSILLGEISGGIIAFVWMRRSSRALPAPDARESAAA